MLVILRLKIVEKFTHRHMSEIAILLQTNEILKDLLVGIFLALVIAGLA